MEGEIKLPRPKLFVGGVKRNTTGQDLEKHFQQYGHVKDAFIVYSKQTSRSRGFGFVEFQDPSAAHLALQHHHIILGRKVDVYEAQLKRTDHNNETGARDDGENGHRRSKTVFVGGLPSTITPDEFRSFFETLGAVTNAVVVYDKQSSEPRGFGFVTFESEDSADKALKDRFYQLNGSQVEVKRAIYKNNNNSSYDDSARRYHEYCSRHVALNYSAYVNGYYDYYGYNNLHQHALGFPYYWTSPPGMMGNYYYNYNYQYSCYPMAAANSASLLSGWSHDPVNVVLHSYGETGIVGHHQEEDKINITNESGDHEDQGLRNLDEVNNGHPVDQQGADSEIRISQAACNS